MLRPSFYQSIFSFVLFGTFLFCSSLYAQPLKKVREFKAGAIENVSVDRLGNFFLIAKNGEIKKYDANGKVLASLKEDKVPALIEPWFHPKIFVYRRENQRYINYNRNFEKSSEQQLDPSIAIQPLLVCPTNDNKILVLDGADWSIKKANPFNNEVTSEFYLDSTKAKPNYVYLREYQNLIFLLNKGVGIDIYNLVGKKVNQLKTDAANFGFFGEELYFLQQDKVVFFDLYTEKIRLVEVGSGKFVLVSDERILLVKENGRVVFLEYKSKEGEQP